MQCHTERSPLFVSQLAVLRRRQRFRGPLQSQSSETDLTSTTTASSGSSSTIPIVNVSSAGAAVSSAGVSGAAMGSASVAGGEVVLRQPVAPGLGVKSRLERRKSSVFSSDSAKRKWRLFERKVSVWLSLHVCPSICLDFIFHQCLVQYLPVSVSVTPYVIVHPKRP